MIIRGADYHPGFQQIAFVDTDTGELQERRLEHREDAEKFYRDLAAQELKVRIGMEASGHARWFERLLGELQFELWIGDAAEIRTKRVRKQKTDRQDAQLILRLLLENRFPQVWVPSWENRDLRQLLWHRHRMVQARTRIMNQLQAVGLNEGLRCKKKLWRDAGREQLESFRLAPWASRRRHDLLELLDRLTPTIAELTQAIEQEAEKCPAAQRLQTHPGVGALTALAFVLIIGRADRFECGKQIASYLGLVPSEESSGQRRRLGHITKQGNSLLRFLLVEAAQVTVRSDQEWRNRYFHLVLRRGRKIAKVADGTETGGSSVLDVAQGIRNPNHADCWRLGAGMDESNRLDVFGPHFRTEFVPVACLDDDVFKRGAKLHGVPVVGTMDALGAMVERYGAKELFIAIPSANGAQMRRICGICEQAGVRYRTVPNLHELLLGRGSISQLREVAAEDLLGRDPVQLDLSLVRNQIAGKVVMVTGAAGSIGSELCRQVLAYSPAKLIVLDHAETPMFYLQLQLTKQAAGGRVVYAVADVANTRRVRQILGEGAVDIIFHAAAYKHVPLVELNVRDALHNNVLAVPPLLDVAEECGYEAFLSISSDKAVEPTSFMGATKRPGELILAARPKKDMRCISVRFGNVMGSQGSVIPVFKEQIEKEGRITITHPEITRFFMTIPEAVSLVLQAFTMGEHGDILVLDMGGPVRILDLAHSLIRQCGKSPSEIKIEFVGLRPGEKLHEHLFYARERQLPTTNRKVKRTQSEIIPWPALWAHLADLISLTNSGTEVSIRAKMKEIIPEYSYQTEPVHVQNEPAENVFSPTIGIARPFAAGAGQD